MTDIFVSYSRKDTTYAKELVKLLHLKGFDVWLDETNIPNSQSIPSEILEGIQNSDCFVFLISPDSVQSNWCKQEIEVARAGKKIITVLIRDTDPLQIPDDIREIKWINLREGMDPLARGIDEIVSAIQTDQKWVKFHTRLQNKALEWEKSNDKSRLIRGRELIEADQMLSSYAPIQKLKPTEQQLRFLYQSRRHEASIRRNLTVAGMFAGIALLTAAIIAIVQRNSAIRTAEVNQSLALSAYAQNAIAQNDQDLALALAMEAVRIDSPPPQSVSMLSQITFGVGTRTMIPVSEEYGVFRLVITPDGNTILSVTGAGEVQLWDIKTGQQIRRIGDHGTYDDNIPPLIPGVTITPNSKIAITAGGEDIRFWDLGTGKLIRRIYIGENLGFNVADFSDDAEILAWGSSDGSVNVWNLINGIELSKLVDSQPSSIESIDLSPDKTKVLAGTKDGRVILWDIDSGQKIREYNLQVESFIGESSYAVFKGVAFSPDGEYVVGAASGGLEVWNIDTGEIVQHFNVNQSMGNPRFSPDKNYLLLPTIDGAEIWDLSSGQLAQRLRGHSSWILDASFSPDGNQVITGSLDGTMRVWDLHSNTNDRFFGHTSRITSLGIDSDGDLLISTSWDGSTRLWDINTGREIHRIKSSLGSKIRMASFSPDGETILVAEDEALSLYSLSNFETLLQIDGISPQVLGGIGYLGSGEKIFSANYYYSAHPNQGALFLDSPDASIQIRDIATGEILSEFFNRGLTESMIASAVGPSGKIILSSHAFSSTIASAADTAGAINGWNVETGEKILNIPVNINQDMPVVLAISPDEKMFASGTMTGEVVIYEMDSGKSIRNIFIGSSMIRALVFSHDGSMLAASDMENSLIIWNTLDWSENSRWTTSEEGFVQSLVFSKDNSRLFGGTDSGLIISWLINKDLADTINWVYVNRYIRLLTCEEREEYNLSIRCDADGNMPAQQATADLDQMEVTPTKIIPDPVAEEASTEVLYTQKINGVFAASPLLYSFEAPSGTNISVLVSSDQFDPYIIVKDEKGNIIQVNDDDPQGGSNDAVISNLEIRKTGTYYLIVDSYLRLTDVGHGEFEIAMTVQDEDNSQAVKLQPVQRGLLGMVFDKDVNQPVEVHGVYENSAVRQAEILPGDTIVSINGIDTRNLSNRQVWDLVLAPPGIQLKLQVVTRSSSPNGTPITVTLNENTLGNYFSIGRLIPGEKSFGYVDEKSPALWDFWGERDQEYALLVGGMNTFTGNVEIMSADGTSLMRPMDVGNRMGLLVFTPQLIQPFKPERDGYYYVSITDDKVTADITTYTLALQRLRNAGKAPLGVPVVENLSATEGVYWTFNADEGQFLNFKLDINDSLVEPFLILMGPDGHYFTEAFDGFDKFTGIYDNESYPQNISINGFPIPQKGEYKLILLPYLRVTPVQQTGNFTLQVNLEKIEVESFLQAGTPFSTNLSVGETRLFGYQGQEGEKIRITVKAKKAASSSPTYHEAAVQDLLDTVLIVLDENGVPLAGSDDYADTTDSQLELTLPSDGHYMIEVITYRNFGRGEISILVEQLK